MANKAEKARELGQQYEKTCTGCAQTTLAAVMDALDTQSEDAFRAASGLADGVGLSGDGSCGALTGGAMAIGGAVTEAGAGGAGASFGSRSGRLS